MLFLMNSRIIWVIVILTLTNAEKVRYDNYSLFRIQPRTPAQVELLLELEGNDDLDFWAEPASVESFVSVLTSPKKRNELEEFLKLNDIEAVVTMSNIQTAIDDEKINKYTIRNHRSMTWDAYYPLDDINEWLDDLVVANAEIVTPIVGGTTYEGREIRGIKISHGSGRRAIFLEGGIHSREWISPATVNYITNELLYSSDAETKAAAEGFDWYIFPVTNPDGYVFTFESNRMWRKNRKPVGTNSFGIDLNRNWNSNWLVIGASSNPNSDTYAGNGPFSEIETRTLSTYIRSIGDKMDLYLSFHAFSQLLMVPYGNTTDKLDNYWDAVTIGRRAVGALSVRYNTQYVVGNIAEAIYHAAGSSVDWVKEQLRVPLVYCYELRDLGQTGFLLPTDQIIPNCEETMDSVLAIIREAQFIGYMNSSTMIGMSSLLAMCAFVIALFFNSLTILS